MGGLLHEKKGFTQKVSGSTPDAGDGGDDRMRKQQLDHLRFHSGILR
jgi:hypothetical protein